MALVPETEYGNAQRLTNADFRKLLMTPRSSMPATQPMKRNPTSQDATLKETEVDDRAERRRKKKSFYAKLKKEEDEKSAELAKKYRDRAFERRDGANTSALADDEMMSTNGYRAVAPDIKTAKDQSDRRRQMIQESKFLGGDMEHTHLVKGLDYALLQKVRCEIEAKEPDKQEEMELEKLVSCKPKKKQDNNTEFKTNLGRNIYNAVFPPKVIKKNELFAPGRMAYSINLDNDLDDNDIPTTIIRSRSDCPDPDATVTLSINDFVIQKLAGIISKLRFASVANKKARKKDKVSTDSKPEHLGQNDSIYGNIGEYKYTASRDEDGRKGQQSKHHGSNLEKPNEALAEKSRLNSAHNRSEKVSTATLKKQQRTRFKQLLQKLTAEPEGYAECYPGLEEMHDAIQDSDDEVDYSKMDLGNRKGPMKRWDFETQEEYGEYMGSKEALPRAAFQYGVKMANGRRTRKHHKENNQKMELDREWRQIQSTMQNSKVGAHSDEPRFKRPKY